MYDIDAALNRQILEVMRNRPTVIFTEPYDARVVEAACYLARFCRPVFLAREEDLKAVISHELRHVEATRVEFTLSESAFVDIDEREDLVQEFLAAYLDLPEDVAKTQDPAAARALVSQPAHFGIMAVRQGHADMVVGGARHEPREFFRPLLRLLARQEVLCEAGVFVLPDEHPADIFPHNIVVFGDVGVNATMTPEILAHVAVGTCAVARDLIPEETLPVINGALVSYSNRGSDEGPSPDMVRQAAKLIPAILADRIRRGRRYSTIRIESEVKVSVALSRRSATYYRRGQERTFIGGTNVIIAPNLDLGNFLFHLHATRFAQAQKLAVIFGIRFQGVDLPMDVTAGDAALSVKASILRLHRFGHWSGTPRDTFFHRYRVLAINPGPTSTRIAIYEGDLERLTAEITHSAAELTPRAGQAIAAQYGMREQAIVSALVAQGLSIGDMDAVSARGGLLGPVPHGTYAVNERMRRDLLEGKGGEHAANLGALIAAALVAGTGKPAFIVDPASVDEVDERAKITGLKEIRRQVISHALNQIATARRYARENETFYESLNLIVGHLGDGITIGAHRKGRTVDVNNGLNGEGPFTPQRCGSLPTGQLIALCLSGKYTREELDRLTSGRGGLMDLLGTGDFQDVERRVQAGDAEAATVVAALVYQIAKHIAALVPAFDGEPVDQILLTGGLARSTLLVQGIEAAVAAVGCGVTVYAGEFELQALARGALRVLSGKEAARQYNPPPTAG